MPNFINQLITPRQHVPSLDDTYSAPQMKKQLGMPNPWKINDPVATEPVRHNPLTAYEPFYMNDGLGNVSQLPLEQPHRRMVKQPSVQFAPDDFEDFDFNK